MSVIHGRAAGKAGQLAGCRAGAGGRVSPAGSDGGQPGEQDAGAVFEFGGAVAGGQDGVLDEFLEIVQDVAVQELAP